MKLLIFQTYVEFVNWVYGKKDDRGCYPRMSEATEIGIDEERMLYASPLRCLEAHEEAI